MKYLKLTLIIIFLLKITSLSYGWGRVGHNIIVEIAKNYIPKNIQDSVNNYLGEMSWESASTWMDDMRNNKQYDYMKEWHYINLDKGFKYDSTVSKGNNVVNQLQIAIRNLKHKSKLTKEEINFNLKVLFHLIGDLHQPLHAGYGSDKGGNDIKVIFNGKQVKLHHVWDTDIIENKNITLKDIQNIFAKTSKHRLKKFSDGDVFKWFIQTRKLLDFVYTYPNEIDEKYINKSFSVIENQLLFAGIRLGKTLNDIFEN